MTGMGRKHINVNKKQISFFNIVFPGNLSVNFYMNEL